MSDSFIRGLVSRVSPGMDGAARCSLAPFAGFVLSVFEDGGIGSFVTLALERGDSAFATTESSVSLAISRGTFLSEVGCFEEAGMGVGASSGSGLSERFGCTMSEMTCRGDRWLDEDAWSDLVAEVLNLASR